MPTLDLVLLGEINKEHHKDTTQCSHQGINLQSVVARQCFDAGTGTENEKDIEEITANDITKCNITVLLEGCHARGREFWKRCTQSHNGQTDDCIAYTKRLRDRGSTLDNHFTTHHQAD